MSTADQERLQAAQLPEDDVIRQLLEQHARIRELFQDVKSATGDHKQHAFDELRALLAVHETAEEMLLRPATRKTAGDDVAEARNDEEKEANEVLARLEKMGTEDSAFTALFDEFEASVSAHAEREEQEEFPEILSGCDEEQRAKMGRSLQRLQSMAPTHPHPSTAGSTAGQWMVGPFASIVDRVRDALTSSS